MEKERVGRLLARVVESIRNIACPGHEAHGDYSVRDVEYDEGRVSIHLVEDPFYEYVIKIRVKDRSI